MCPIVYNNIWDEMPVPTFNKTLYQSVDAINCISYLTYEMVKTMCPEKTNYIPHALPTDIFFPI